MLFNGLLAAGGAAGAFYLIDFMEKRRAPGRSSDV